MYSHTDVDTDNIRSTQRRSEEYRISTIPDQEHTHAPTSGTGDREADCGDCGGATASLRSIFLVSKVGHSLVPEAAAEPNRSTRLYLRDSDADAVITTQHC